jgi:hypothetical protein
MKHYGLQHTATKKWLMDSGGIIFWTTSKKVAEEQLKLTNTPPNFKVCEFVDDNETN